MSLKETHNILSNELEWVATVQHEPLLKIQEIRGHDKEEVTRKANALLYTWKLMWRKYLIAYKENDYTTLDTLNFEQKKILAKDITKKTQEELKNIKTILNHTLSIDDAIDWENFKDRSEFIKPKPETPQYEEIPSPPLKPNIKLTFKDKLLSRSDDIIRELEAQHDKNFTYWENTKKSIKTRNEKLEKSYNSQLSLWEQEKHIFYKSQKTANRTIDIRKKEYLEANQETIIEYCRLVLLRSEYPQSFKKDFDIEFTVSNRILILDYSLPPITGIPTLKAVTYVTTRDEFKESHISERELNKIYDNLLYEISLRSIHELFEADVINTIDSIVFNGWVKSYSKSTGEEFTACIMTVQTTKDQFWKINIEKIDPKTCFNNLKGIGSSKLHSLIPVAPIITINREDNRFVSSYDVVNELDETYNLAAMDWEDFEHLIRELFEKEFRTNGGEVKVTQASRDGGVDAIAFDPDPIRGGKIVIQAKRYTNTVGVSAVRDLYGTVVNEGATKGILVTTSDYGPDAYEFAKGKPLSLLNGSNLLHLLEKHGHKAKIDLQEAKKILAENDNR